MQEPSPYRLGSRIGRITVRLSYRIGILMGEGALPCRLGVDLLKFNTFLHIPRGRKGQGRPRSVGRAGGLPTEKGEFFPF